jgi:anti-anti-sigma factor
VTVARVDVGELAGAPLVTLTGEIDLSNVDEVMFAIESSVSNTAMGLLLDLRALTYLDSTGLRLLFRLARQLHERDQHLTLVVPETALIYRILVLGGVFDAMHVVPDIETLTQRAEVDRPVRTVAGEDL